MTITGERLSALRKEKGLTQNDVSKRVGIARSTLTNYEKGVRFPKPKVLIALAGFYGVDREYLEGTSETRRKIDVKNIYENAFAKGKKQERESLLTRLYQRTIPIYSCKNYEAGAWKGEYPEDRMIIPDAFLTAGKEYFANPADSDSMSPLFVPEDILIFEKSDVIESGQIGAFYLNGEYCCKRYCRLADESIVLLSENNAYEPIMVKQDDDFKVVGIYRMRLSKEN